MGVAYSLSCKHCTYQQNVFLGVGFLYCDLNTISTWYEDEEGRRQLKEFLNEKETDVSHDCFDGLYVCPSCRFLLNKAFLHIESGNRTYTNHYSCPRCHASMPEKPLQDLDRSGGIDCPDCSSKDKLDVSFYMDWD